MSAATAFREQRLFREALPKESTPTRIWELVRDQVPVKDRKGKEAAAARAWDAQGGDLTTRL